MKEHKITCHHRTEHIHDGYKCRCICTCFIPEEKLCNAENTGVKCKPPCNYCYGGETITASSWEERFVEVVNGLGIDKPISTKLFNFMHYEIAMKDTLKALWLQEFVGDNKRCCLCRNGGMLVDMDGIRRNCICPNGRFKVQNDKTNP